MPRVALIGSRSEDRLVLKDFAHALSRSFDLRCVVGRPCRGTASLVRGDVVAPNRHSSLKMFALAFFSAASCSAVAWLSLLLLAQPHLMPLRLTPTCKTRQPALFIAQVPTMVQNLVTRHAGFKTPRDRGFFFGAGVDRSRRGGVLSIAARRIRLIRV